MSGTIGSPTERAPLEPQTHPTSTTTPPDSPSTPGSGIGPGRRWTGLRYWCSYAIRHYFGAGRLQSLRRRCEREALEFCERHADGGPTLHDLVQIPADELTPRKFRKRFLRPNLPVVIKGLAADWKATRNWSPEFFRERYGDRLVPVRTTAGNVDDEGILFEEIPLAELIDGILAGKEFAGSNLEDLFNENPELRRDLDIPVLERYFCTAFYARMGSTQLFISSPTARSQYHCATGVNLFVNVYGSKRWTFVSPAWSIAMYPQIRKDMFYAASPVDWRKSYDELDAEGYPLYRYAPKYRVDLEPGDVVFSPQWWWHGVENNDVTIGVATRTLNNPVKGNRLFSTMGLLSPATQRNNLRAILKRWPSDATGAKTIFTARSKSDRPQTGTR